VGRLRTRTLFERSRACSSRCCGDIPRMGHRVPFVYHLALLRKTGQNQVQRMRITKTKRPTCPKQADYCLTTVFPHPKSYQDFRTGPNPVSRAETPACLGEEMPLLKEFQEWLYIPARFEETENCASGVPDIMSRTIQSQYSWSSEF